MSLSVHSRGLAAWGLLSPPLALALWPWSPRIALLQMFVSHCIVLYSTLRANCPWFGPVATRFATDRREVWLTIDDGPHPSDTRAMLDLLARHGARATFFLEGARAAAHPDLVREIVTAGHTVENHSHTHPAAWFWSLGPWRARREVERCSAALEAVTGRRPALFRPVVGMANPFVHRAARQAGLIVTGWSARGYDGVWTSVSAVLARLWPDVRPGAILLLHQRPGDGNAAILGAVLERLDREDYRCVVPEVHRLR